jgi:hypothetical protein
MKKITNWAFLLALASTVPVFGQDYLIPVASTNAATCGAPPFVVAQQSTGFVSCARLGYFHWFAVGGGWATAFTLSNPTSYDMAVAVSLLAADGVTANTLTVVRNGTNLGAKSSDALLLPKHGSIRYELPNSGAPDQTNGQVQIQVLAKDALALQSIQATEDYTFTDSTGVAYSTVTLPIAWTDQAASAYTATFAETSTDSSFGSFALKNVSTSAQTVDVQAYDIGGNLLGDQKVDVAAQQVVAKTADGLFGASVFQSLSPAPIARLQFTGTDRINVLVLQLRGKSVGSMPASAVLEQ